jgi:hypothetical protein
MGEVATADSVLAAVRGQLISQHYLAHQLVNREDWKALASDPRAAQMEHLFQEAKPTLATNKPGSKGSNEDAVRGHLLNPAFEILGLRWSPGMDYLGTKPDYALYRDRPTFEKGQSLINEGKEFDALKLSCGVVEAERWGKEFGEKPARSDLSDPIFQIEFYLGNARRSGGPRWGILTNVCPPSAPSKEVQDPSRLSETLRHGRRRARLGLCRVRSFCFPTMRASTRYPNRFPLALKNS